MRNMHFWLRHVVQDFTEVDNNVTRHLSNETQQNDWNGMVLHYLGLDHIGHKSGPIRQSTRYRLCLCKY